MRLVLEKLFSMFGKRAIGQVVGATVIGAVLPFLLQRRVGIPYSELHLWSIGFSAVGFVAALILLSPSLFFGSTSSLLGIVIILAPMRHADGVAVTWRAYAVKASIGVVLLVLGVILVYRRVRAFVLQKRNPGNPMELNIDRSRDQQ